MTEVKRGPHGWAKGSGPREVDKSSGRYPVKSGPTRVWEPVDKVENSQETGPRESTAEELGRAAAAMRQEPGTRVYGLGDATSGSW